MTYYLVKYSDNWADEMDIEGHVILNEEEYEKFQNTIDEKENFEFVVGSNQSIEYDDIEDLKYRIDVEEITAEEYAVFKKLGFTKSGFAPDLIRQVQW